MESAVSADQGSDGDLLKPESAAGPGEKEPTRNGYMREDSKKENIQRNPPSSDVEEDDGGGPGGEKKCFAKLEDHARGEIPAHHARRPPNGFLLFCKRHRDIVSAKNPNLENRGVTKLLGNWWRTLEEEEREKYKELARQNKEIFIANNPQFTWYKLPAPPLRTLVTRPSNRRPPKLEPSLISNAGPITPGKLADESQLGGLTSLLSSSLSPPTTPLNTSPPSPTAITAPAPPKKRFLLKTRTKQSGEDGQSLSDSDDQTDDTKKCFKTAKKKYKKKKSWNSLKYKKNLKMKWNESFSNKLYLEKERNGPDPWKSENGCTQQKLIEKIVDSSFDSPKPFQDFDVQRTLDYINTEHTYQKNPTRFWQQQKQQKSNKKDEYVAVQVVTKVEGAERNIICPNLNNNTIVISETRPEVKNGLSYSFNDQNNLIIDCVDPNQRKQLDQSSMQTNHDRIRTFDMDDGYIPGGKKRSAKDLREDCDNLKRLEDQIKPLKIAQNMYEGEEDEEVDEDEGEDGESENDEEDEESVEIPKNCDRDDANFQSILGKVSREIVSMMKERGPEITEDMTMARFKVKEKSETDSDGSWYDKSDGSPPESPGGRRSKRSCKGQRYEQFIKDSVSKKRSKASETYGGMGEPGKKGGESKSKKRKLDQTEETNTGKEGKGSLERVLDMSGKEKELIEESKDNAEFNSQTSEDLTVKHGTKASDIIQLKLDLESKLKREGDDKIKKRQKEMNKISLKKKPVSKVQMIKEKKELHVGEFNLNEKIEELPLLSFESFLQKKRQRKKRLLGLKKDGIRNKMAKNRLEKYRGRSPSGPDSTNVVPIKSTNNPGHSISKPDFADLATLAETALTLLSLREPR